jgi:hypothetical protein
MPIIDPANAIHIEHIHDIARYNDEDLSQIGLEFKGHTYRLDVVMGRIVRDDLSSNRFVRAFSSSIEIFSHRFAEGSNRSRAMRLDAARLPDHGKILTALPFDKYMSQKLQRSHASFGDNGGNWWDNGNHAYIFAAFSLIGKKLADGSLKVNAERLKDLDVLHQRFLDRETHRGTNYEFQREILTSGILEGLLATSSPIEIKEHIQSLSTRFGSFRLNAEHFRKTSHWLFRA